ncbi:MAG: L,D-transpeptidase family protein, partial [Xanthomonadaceae bacterium]|nr:L,D-transpeptidase family protein [Xanthomonadaceae bacterium]
MLLICGLLLCCSFAVASAFAQTPVATERKTVPPPNVLPKPPPNPPSIELRAGEYLWMPQLAPKGPVVIVVSLPEQLAYVYRNGVRIAISTVSTGKRGYETPTG